MLFARTVRNLCDNHCRLTESGLSMTTWSILKGMRPPLNDADWIVEFEKYKQYPEYKMYVQTIR